MTTPEALRARQMQILKNEEGLQATQDSMRKTVTRTATAVMIMGLTLIAVVIYFNWQDGNQREHNADADRATRRCIADNTADQNEVLRIRGDLAERESAVNARDTAITAHWQTVTQRLFVLAGSQQDDPGAIQAAYLHTQMVWARLDRKRVKVAIDRAQIKEEREKNPIPDFPKGICE